MQTRSYLQRRSPSESQENPLAVRVQPRSWGIPQKENLQHNLSGVDTSKLDLFSHDPGPRPMPRLMPKLTVGAPNDVYEQEADRVADQVMSMPDAAMKTPVQREAMPEEEEEVQAKPVVSIQREELPEEEEPIQAKLIQREELPEEEVQTKSLGSNVQRKQLPEEEEPIQTKLIQREDLPEEEEVQAKPLGNIQREEIPEEEEVQTKSLGGIQREEMPEDEEEIQIKPVLQRSSNDNMQASDSIESRLSSSKGSGSPLPDDVRTFMEPRFGADFSQVRVHTGSEAVQMNRDLSAQAFTHKQDLYFGSGKAPGKNELTAHELTHVVQQTGETRLQRKDQEPLHGNSCGCSNCVLRTPRVQLQPTLEQAGEAMQLASKTQVLPDQSNTRIQRSFWGSIKKGFQKLGSGIKNVAEAAWGGIKKTANSVWTGMKWVSTQLWSKFTGIFLRTIEWIKNLPARVGRLLTHVWEGVKSLKPWSLKWWESFGQLSTWGGLLKWLGTVLVDLLEIAGIGEIAETISDFIKFNTRPLDAREIAIARSVFGNSINYSLVRVDEGAILGPSWSDRPYTSFHTINSWKGMSDDTLIHELTHVWQYEQDGAIYMPQAIHAQVAGAGYDYGGVTELQKRQKGGQGLTSFNREQQAQILEDYYLIKTGKSSEKGLINSTDLPLYEHFVSDVRH